MFAMGFTEYGGTEVLRTLDVPEPEPGPGEVRVRVKAVGVNPIDWKLRSGAMAGFRPVQFPYVPGIELAGVVDRVGEGVPDLRAGDEVLGPAVAAYAELAIARAEQVLAKPEQVPWELAAALPVASETAYRMLAHVSPAAGQTVLVHGAAGGVGSVATAFAVADGVRVVGTAGEVNHDYLRSLGAVPVTYGEGWPERVRAAAPEGVDAVLDTAGRGVIEESVALAGGPDRVVTIADPGAQRLGVKFSSGLTEPRSYHREGIGRALELIAQDRLPLPIWRAYPLVEAPLAHRASEEGHLRGKIVLIVES